VLKRNRVKLIAIVEHSDGGSPHLSATASVRGRVVRRTFDLTNYDDTLGIISGWLEELKYEPREALAEFAFL